MIKTRSPYYIDVPFISPATLVTCYAFKLSIYVWQGDKYTTPSTASWVKTIENPEGLTGNRSINISPLINSYIDFNTQSTTNGLVDGNNQLWVKASVEYQQTSDLVYEPEQDIFIQLAVIGYGSGMGGENQDTPSDKVLLTGRDFKVNAGGKFVIPLKIDEPTPPTPSLLITNITDDGGGDYTFTYASVGTYSELTFIMVNSVPQSTYPVVSTDVTSPTTINNTAPDIVQGYMQGFDTATGQSITSNTFTI